MALAMTVGATKTQLLQQRAMDSLAPKPVEAIKPSPGLIHLDQSGRPSAILSLYLSHEDRLRVSGKNSWLGSWTI